MMMNTDDDRPAGHIVKAEPLSGEYIDFHQMFGDGSGATAAFHEQVIISGMTPA